MSLSLEVSKFIEKEKLFLDSEPLLCAVSGGMDSMVMLDILRTLGYPLEIAHINYMLRGDDSMMDEATVIGYCDQYELDCHTYRLSADEVKDLKSGNLQEKARDIRYKWFNQLNERSPERPICTAHHQGDVAETFLLHALRGSGTKGLSSIRSKNGIYRRPLLNTDRVQIHRYAHDNRVPFRQDLSNLDSVYDRNYIRHEIIAPLTKRWPEAVKKLKDASANISRDHDLLTYLVNEAAQKWCLTKDQYINIGPLTDLRETPHAQTLLFHILRKYDFTSDMVDSILEKNVDAGAIFQSPTHEGSINQDHLILKKIENSKKKEEIEVVISKPSIIETALGTIKTTESKHEEKKASSDSSFIELIDATKVSWPLTLRTWKLSDRISPLGMKGKQKKVSDILIDQKANRFEKEEQLVLSDSNDQIIWVIGRKLSDHVKYSDGTTQYLKLEFKRK